MKAKTLILLSAFAGSSALAFPPAPHHEVYGSVRDEQGHPITNGGTVTFSGSEGDLISGLIDPTIARGVNYRLKVPMDAGTLSQLYTSTALLPNAPFTITVKINEVAHVPIEVQGGFLAIGDPGKKTRLDLTLGVDSDGDGLPDSWEQKLIDVMEGVNSLADVTRDGDLDGDGVSNYTEYLVGTYAFDKSLSFDLKIVKVEQGLAHFKFLTVKGRSYQLHASENGEKFTPLEFSIKDGESPRETHLALSTRFQNISIPAELIGSRLFRLHVQ